MSDEAENAATRQVIDSFKRAKEAKAALEGQMSALGDKLAEFARVLKRPGEYRFLVSRVDITVGHPIEMGNPPRRPVVRLGPDDLKWEAVTEMVSNYDKARSDKAESAARLRNRGWTLQTKLKVDKAKFDALLDRMLRAKPLKREDVKTGRKRLSQVIEPRTQPQPSR